MLYVIVYDISSSAGRLRRAAKTCEYYGVRVEKSVFEADLDEVEFAEFWSELCQGICPEEDSLIAYRICEACRKDILTVGVATRLEPMDCIVI